MNKTKNNIESKQTKFSYRLYEKISNAVQFSGTFNPEENLYQFEEDLTIKEYNLINAFLGWCHQKGKVFGSGNYQTIFDEFQNRGDE